MEEDIAEGKDQSIAEDKRQPKVKYSVQAALAANQFEEGGFNENKKKRTRYKRNNCLVFKLLLLKNLRISIRRKCMFATMLFIPAFLCVLSIFLFKYVFDPTSYPKPTVFEPLQIDALPPAAIPFQSLQNILVVSRDPMAQFAMIHGMVLPVLAGIAQNPNLIPKSSLEQTSEVLGVVRNLQRFKIGFAPRTSKTLRVMNRVARRLNLDKVVDFGSEKTMVDAINDELVLKLTKGIDAGLRVRFASFLCGIYFDFKGSKDVKLKIRFASDSIYTTDFFRVGNNSGAWWTEYKFRDSNRLGPWDGESARSSPNYYLKGFIAVQWAISKALLEEDLKISKDFEEQTRRFPLVSSQKMAYPPYVQTKMLEAKIFVVYLASFIVIFWDMIRIVGLEKETGMKEMLSIMGVGHSMQWAAWWTRSLIIVIPVAVVVSATMAIIFNYVSFFVVFVLFFFFFIAFIALAFFITSWVSSAMTAGVIGFGIYFAMLVMTFYIKETTAFGYKMAASLLISVAFNSGFDFILHYDNHRAWLDLGLINTPVSINKHYTLLHSILMLMLDAFICIVLTRYVEEVSPGKFGVAKHPCFCFFKCCSDARKRKRMKMMQYEPQRDYGDIEPDEFYEVRQTDHTIGIAIRDLVKVYGSGACANKTKYKRAVNGISLNMYEEEIFVLLGHNGAGKSSTMNVITGYYPPTSGNVWVNGLNTKDDMDLIREKLTYCPQHDILFGDLTVEEHLMFFGTLQGISKDDMESHIGSMCHDLKMEDKRKTRTKNLSGGTRRKTSMAMALIGDARVTILDEPTSGVDVSARHCIWQVIHKARSHRTIILSTHFMDEAEALADQVAIMAAGLIVCCGSTAFLKRKFGLGYHLTIVKGPKCDVSAMLASIEGFVPGSKLDRDIAGEANFLIPKTNPKLFPALFEYLDNNKQELGILCYGATMDSMEEVYIRAGEARIEAEIEQANANLLRSRLFSTQLSTSNRSTEWKPASASQSQLYPARSNPKYNNKNSKVGVEAEDMKINAEATNNIAEGRNTIAEDMSNVEGFNNNSAGLNSNQDGFKTRTSRLMVQADQTRYESRLTINSFLDFFNVNSEKSARGLKGKTAPSRLSLKDTENLGITISKTRRGTIMKEARSTIIHVKPGQMKAYHMRAMFIKRILASLRNWKIVLLTILVPIFLTLLSLILWTCTADTQQNEKPLTMEISEVGYYLKIIAAGKSLLANAYFSYLFIPSTDSKYRYEEYCEKDNLFNLSVLDNCVFKKAELKHPNTDQKYDYLELQNLAMGAGFDTIGHKCFGPGNNPDEYRDEIMRQDYSNIYGTTSYICLKYAGLTNRANRSFHGNSIVRAILNHTLEFLQQITPSGSIARYSEKHEMATAYFNDLHYHAEPTSLALLTNAIAFKLGTKLRIEIVNHPLPKTAKVRNERQVSDTGEAITIEMGLNYATFLVTPFFIFGIIKERVTGAKHLQLLAGVWKFAYWFANFVWDFLFYQIPVLIIILLFLIFNYKLFVIPGLDKLYVPMLFFGLSQLPLLYLFSFGISEPVMGVMVFGVFNLLGELFPQFVVGTIVELAFKEKDPQTKQAKTSQAGHWFYANMTRFFSVFLSPTTIDLTFRKILKFGKKKLSCDYNDLSTTDVVTAILQDPNKGGEALKDSSFWLGVWYTDSAAIKFFAKDPIYEHSKTTIDDIKNSKDALAAICKFSKGLDVQGMGISENLNDGYTGDPIAFFCCSDNLDQYAEQWNPGGTVSDIYTWEGIGEFLVYFSIQCVVFFLLLVIVEVALSRQESDGAAKCRKSCRKKKKESEEEEEEEEEDADVVAEREAVARFVSDVNYYQSRNQDGGKIHSSESVKKMKEYVPERRSPKTPLDPERAWKDTPRETAIVVDSLVKRYGSFVAVAGSSFAVEQGELFGLLGVNGAGKSTTFKMLSGDVKMTEGNIWLTTKYNMRKNLPEIQQRLGYCPQYDAIIGEMTGREMLWMFSYLRGIKRKQIPHMIQGIADALLLTDHLDRQCGSYSGGNKRKLSVAIALIGLPSVVLLDEPSTGVDPIARRKLWEALLDLRDNGDQRIILTSHVMQECEVLCSRLCIMVRGKIKCIGSPQHLKSKFAQGFTVVVEFPDSSVADAKCEAFLAKMLSVFPDARLKEKNHLGTTYSYVIPTIPGRTWGKVFEFFESTKTEFELTDYSVTQTTLEEVFMHLTLKAGTLDDD